MLPRWSVVNHQQKVPALSSRLLKKCVERAIPTLGCVVLLALRDFSREFSCCRRPACAFQGRAQTLRSRLTAAEQ